MPADAPTDWPAMSVKDANALLAAPGSPLALEEATIDGVEMKVYAQAPPSLRHILEASKTHGDRDLLVYEDERVSFAAHARAAAHFAQTLKNVYGIEPGMRVAIIMRNYPQWSVAFWAVVSIGAIATPMNSWWTGDELQYGLDDSGARLAVVDGQIFERIREHWCDLAKLRHIVIARDAEEERPDPEVTPMEHFIGEPSGWASLDDIALPDIGIAPDDDATIMYTSGTTGKPKGALASHRAIIANVYNSLTAQARIFLRRGEQPPEPDPNDQRVTLLSVPFFHATGAFAVLVPALIQANKIVTMYKWDAGEALPIIERERVSAVGGVPAIAWQLLEHPDRKKYDLSSIQGVSYGGAPSAPDLVATIKKTFPDAIPAMDGA